MKFLLYLATLPGIIIGFLIYKSDKREKEPISELLKAFFLGIISAVLTVCISYILGIHTVAVTDMTPISQLFGYAFFCVAFIEEGCKWVCAILFLRKNKNYNYLFDGIVYAVFVSLGFATIENIIYSLVGGLRAVLVRGVLTVPAHAFFGVFMGYYFSFTKLEKGKNKNYLSFLILSIFVPVLLHGVFDFLLLSKEPLCLILFILFVIGLYIISIRRIFILTKLERPFLVDSPSNQKTSSRE